ncbi:MAG: hypothetical protein U9O97_05880 [Elusimicrobiota bacterium]|nr:hypothetical protein [Elusimicrobiota bacterium]
MLIVLNIALPVIAGLVYFAMAYEIKKSNRGRTLILGELTIKGTFYAYVALGLWLMSRPLQNIIGPYPAPLIVNCVRQFLMIAVFAPSLLVAIFNWTSEEKKVPKTVQAAIFIVAAFMGLMFILINIAAVDGSKIIAQNSFITLYDAKWFVNVSPRIELVLIHLLVQGISPVGFCFFAAGIVRHKRHNYPADSIYNMMTKKWYFLEVSLIIFACSMLAAGIAALLTGYGTYLWVIYFAGAIVAGFFDMKGIKLPPRIEK